MEISVILFSVTRGNTTLTDHEVILGDRIVALAWQVKFLEAAERLGAKVEYCVYHPHSSNQGQRDPSDIIFRCGH
jgi:hypothetical protein